MWSMFEIIQKLAPAPPAGLYSPVAPLSLPGTWYLRLYPVVMSKDLFV